jgi:hypothetical protein
MAGRYIRDIWRYLLNMDFGTYDWDKQKGALFKY